ncbi:glucose-1-phosphate thymidylyltransferase [Nonomuraea sp. B12E4]|uniref:glucose-1-phosphate thymidylyltransferase n=1 Tax=Nonomuraea sp. B12E4 TaxID=3153564 RepID=UPI00325F443A
MKALVLAGGSGTRLRPFSYSMPKQLMPVANTPVLEHVLRGILDIGITEVGLIVGDWATEIAETVGNGSRFGQRITYLRQDHPRGLAHCVRVARDFLGDEDFAMYLGDNILLGSLGEVAEEFRLRRPAAQVLVRSVADPRSFGVAELQPNGSVLRLVEKPEQPRSDLALIGVYFFTPAVHEAVAAISPSARGELEITDAIQWLVESGKDVKASVYHGYWKDTGRIEDLLECNARLLSELRRDVAGHVDSVSRLQGEVSIAEGAHVVRSWIAGPVVIGAGTVIEDSYIGPNTSIGRDCTVHSAGLTDSIVLDGASISQVTGVRGSLIGRHATVGAGDRGEVHHRLVIGDHGRIEIAA